MNVECQEKSEVNVEGHGNSELEGQTKSEVNGEGRRKFR